MNKIFLLLLIPLCTIHADAALTPYAPTVPEPLATPLPDDPLHAQIYRLDNGLTVYLSPNPLEPRVSAKIAVRTGSKNDPPDRTGIAHYLEHMLFKGTSQIGTVDYDKEKPHIDRIQTLYEKHFTAIDPKERESIYKEIDAENGQAVRYEVPNEIDKIYRSLGFSQVNAYTSDEQTVYVCEFPSNRAEAWAKIESERFARPVFRLFQSELEAVYEEKNRSLDNAENLLNDTLEKILYKVHPYGQQTTLGEIKHLKNPSLATMHEFYDRYYVPNNMAIALSGDFELAAMLALIKKYFSAWQPRPLPEMKTWPLPKPQGREFASVQYEAEEKVLIAWPTVPIRHPDADALAVMDMIMDNAAAGLINLDLTQQQKVKAAGSEPIMFNDAGSWYLWAVPKRGQTLMQAEGLLMDVVNRLKAGEFTDDEITAVITNFEVDEKLRLESNEARSTLMAASFINFEPWKETADRLERLRAIKKKDVLAVARHYLGEDRVVVYRSNGKPVLPKIAKPGFTHRDIDPARQSAFAAAVLALPAQPLEPRWLVAGRDYTITPTRAGPLYAAHNPVDDLFSLTLLFDIGSRQERSLCAAIDLLEFAGASTISAEEFKKKLYKLGINLDYSCGEQEFSVGLSGLDKNLQPALSLMLMRFKEPFVSTETLKTMMDIELGTRQDNKRNPNSVFHALDQYATRGQDSDILNDLSDKELTGLKLNELKTIISGLPLYAHKIAYVGNRTPEEISRLLDFAKIYRPTPSYRPLRWLKSDKTKIYFVHRDMVQARVGVLIPDEIYDPGHELDYEFYSSYMGGGMSSVIFQEVREARSLAYAAGGGYAAGNHKDDENAVRAQLGCQADKTFEATSLLKSLLSNFPASSHRFIETEQALEQGYRSNPITFRSVPFALIDWEQRGITGGDPRPARFEKLHSYTLEDLKTFAGRLRNSPMVISILGPLGRVKLDELKTLGAVEEKRLDAIFPY